MHVFPSSRKVPARLMGSYGQPINLKQYRCSGGKWQFAPVVEEQGKPDPMLALIDGERISSKGGRPARAEVSLRTPRKPDGLRQNRADVA